MDRQIMHLKTQMADVEPLMDRHIERGQDRQIDRLNAYWNNL